jgi:hypothetical protein
LSVVDLDSSQKLEPRRIAETRLGLGPEFVLADDFLAERNRVTRWVRTG